MNPTDFDRAADRARARDAERVDREALRRAPIKHAIDVVDDEIDRGRLHDADREHGVALVILNVCGLQLEAVLASGEIRRREADRECDPTWLRAPAEAVLA